MKLKTKHVVCSLLVAAQGVSFGATLPTGFSEVQVTNSLSSPTAMEFAPDGRLFVCQQPGQLRVIKNDTLLPTPFLQLTVDSSGERGLLGVTFDPNFAANQRVYVYYTVPGSTAHNRISSFTANGDVAVPGSETVLMDLDNLSTANNHNGGAIHIGADGKLYAGVGDNANSSSAQTLSTVLGKMLRINTDGSIPSDNPFYGSTSGKNRAVWALGLRNPFTFAIQPGTGRILIDDVGENTWEEIDEGTAGANYGWPSCEGVCSPSNPNFVDPIFQYSHANGCAILGGVFYNPATNQFPQEYVGRYFFTDLCGGWIRVLDPDNPSQATTFATGLSSPVDLKVSGDGSLYYLNRGNSSVYRVQFTGGGPPPPPPTTVTLTLLTSPSGLTLQVDGTSVNPPYQFQSAEGAVHTIGAPSAQRLNKSNYRFSSWSDDGAQTHQITTPSTDASYTATYTKKGR